MFTQIDDICYHGNGGYQWDLVYNWPIWLRKFTFNRIKDRFEKIQEERDKQQNMLTGKTDLSKRPEMIKPPDIKPTYTTKTTRPTKK